VASKTGQDVVFQLTRQSLRRFGAQLVEPGADAPVLVLLGDNTRRRTIETDDDGRASAWELEYQLSFTLRPMAEAESNEARGAPLIRTRTVRTSDTYEASPLNVQAEQAQRERIQEELRDEAVRLMLSQVASALDQ
jgi:outer membrane lipopolysaccharide assembly protein LptE/RlpB